MSKNEATKTETIKRTYSGFDANLNEVEKEVSFDFVPPATYEEAVQRLNGDTAKILEGCTAVLRKEEIKKQRENSGANFPISRDVLMETIKTYRSYPQFSTGETDLRKISAEDWDKQTKAICAELVKAPFIVNGMIERTKALATQDGE